MSKQKIFSCLFLLTFVSPSYADSLNRDKWKKEFGLELREGICRADSYFRRCFTVSPAECGGEADKAFATCFARSKAKIPAQLNEALFNEWTPKLKACVGTEVSISFDNAKRTIESEACDPKNDADKKIPRDIYLEQAAVSLPNDLCIDGMPHRNCYAVTEKECQAEMTKAARDCIPVVSKELPSKVRIGSSGYWVTEIAACASPRFDKALAGKRTKKDEYCRNAFGKK